MSRNWIPFLPLFRTKLASGQGRFYSAFGACGFEIGISCHFCLSLHNLVKLILLMCIIFYPQILIDISILNKYKNCASEIRFKVYWGFKDKWCTKNESMLHFLMIFVWFYWIFHGLIFGYFAWFCCGIVYHFMSIKIYQNPYKCIIKYRKRHREHKMTVNQGTFLNFQPNL